MRASAFVPGLMPTLSRGRHLSPRSGACFMEFASYLAGERWSDHPRCTDPVLASLARAVNDLVDDEHRARLLPEIPRVVGLRADGPAEEAALGLRLALRAAVHALPIASMDRQRALAVALRIGLRELAGEAGRELREDVERALGEVPDARRWADEHLAGVHVSRRQFARHGASSMARTAVLGIAEACVDDPEARLVALLRALIDEAEGVLARVDGLPVVRAPRDLVEA